MKVRAFKSGDFEHTHERQAFRLLCERLAADPGHEEVVVIGNATLPDIVYTNPHVNRPYNYRGVSPDVLIVKPSALLVVEMKSHPGQISFPTGDEDPSGEWTFETNGVLRVIAEGKPSPFSQVKHNGQATQAFFEQKVEPLCAEEARGSLWYKLTKVILFTAPKVTFTDAPPYSWRNTFVATLDPGCAGQHDVVRLVADTTTPQMGYRTDNRPQIHVDRRTMDKVVELLGAVPFDFQQTSVVDVTLASPEDDSAVIAPDYGLARVIHVGVGATPVPEEDLPAIEVSPAVLREPVPLRALRYYIHCTEALAKQVSQVSMARTEQYHVVERCEEPVFFGDGQFRLPEEGLPPTFLVPDARLTYGYLLLLTRSELNNRTFLNAEPLFLRDVHLVREGGRLVCQSTAQDEVSLNRVALGRFTAFAALSQEEVEEFVKEVEGLPSVEDKIRHVLKTIGVPWNDGFRRFGGFSYDTLREGLLPLALVFQSTGGFYNRLLRELEHIRGEWLKDPGKRKDLAWSLLAGITPQDVQTTWRPARICVVESNYEQSHAVGLSMRDNARLQVISGPPGTGKTQVIQNIIANAAMEGKHVLFASHNNKAVDVVVDRMNSELFDFPLVFRTGSNQQNQRFAAFLAGLSPADPAEMQKIRNEEPALRRIQRETEGALQRLHEKVIQAEQDRRRLEQVEQRLDELRDTHELLYYLTNWYEKDGTNLGIAVWKKLQESYQEMAKAGDSILTRAATAWKEGMGLRSIASKETFAQRLQLRFVELMRLELPKRLLDVIPEGELLKAGSEVQSVLEELGTLSKSYQALLDSLQTYREEEVLQEWTVQEHGRLDSSRKLLLMEVTRRRKEETIADVSNLLTDWRNRTSFSSVLEAFPCCASTTLAVGNKIPLEPGLFDLAIIDEASQTDVASSLPILFRAQRAVVIGDEMQLRPVVTLNEEVGAALLAAYGLDGEKERGFDVLQSSMLDLANDRFTASGGRRLLLKDHYRSHPDIISFSNRSFYGGALRIRTSRGDTPGIFFHDIQGEAEPRWNNPAEADFVVRQIRQQLQAGRAKEQIGVVTPFKRQKERIREQLKSQGVLGANDYSLLVDTAHGFQGDERDIMLLSLVVAPNMPKGTIQWVHDLSTNSKNLLNVAITRARRELHVVGHREVCLNAGGLLRQLVLYCDRCQKA